MVSIEYEVEVIYLQEKRAFKARKFLRYVEFAKAQSVYVATLEKFRQEKTQALVCLRSIKGDEASLIRSELL